MKKRILSVLLLCLWIVLISMSFSINPNYNNQYVLIEAKDIEHIIFEEFEENIKLEKLETQTLKNTMECLNISENKENNGWAICNVNIRTEPSTDSEILKVLHFGDNIFFENYNEEWLRIQVNYQGYDYGYVYAKYISLTNDYIDYDMPDTIGFKSYMYYTSITNKRSKQYLLQEKYAYTGNYGIRQVNNRYCIAVGTGVDACVGTYVDLILENGETIQCIIGDIKDDRHTDANNIVTVASGCLSEFIVDKKTFNNKAKRRGDVSICNENWNSKVVKIRKYNKNIFID